MKAGYQPKTVRLHYAPGDPALAIRCYTMQQEMLEWASGARRPASPLYDGTLKSLVEFYEVHPDSPYHELRPATAKTYSKTMKSLMKHKGSRRVDQVDGADVRRWYKELVEARSKGWAYFTINVLKTVLAFGATKRIPECRVLREELSAARFHPGSPRKEQLTYQQLVTFRKTAHAMGHDWMALLLTLQFECSLRRIDIIGEWGEDNGAHGIRARGRVWRGGLTWSHIDSGGVLRKLVSKTQFTSQLEAVHAIDDYPLLAAEIARIPSERRVGPVVINPGTGLPPTDAQCRYYFRKIAREAGIPDAVWNMDARAGAVTEAYNSGADQKDVMALATHSEVKTSRRYNRDLTEQSRRAAAARVRSRKEP